MKIRQEASQLGIASERYRISYGQLSESAPSPAAQCARFGTGRFTLILFGRKKLLITPLIIQLQSLSLPHEYVINYPLIIDLIVTHFQNLGLQKGRNTFNVHSNLFYLKTRTNTYVSVPIHQEFVVQVHCA